MDIDIAKLLSRLQEDGLTQSEMAQAIGCSQPTISDLLNGKVGTSRPSYRIVEGVISLAKKRGVFKDEAALKKRMCDFPIPGAPIDGKKVREAKGGMRRLTIDTRKARE